MAAVKCLSVNHSSDYIFWSFGIIGVIQSYSENEVPMKPVLGTMSGVAHFITGHEQT